jgi:hypothetical protein
LIKFKKNNDTFIGYCKSFFFNFKELGWSCQVLGRTKTGGSHKMGENHPTPILTFKAHNEVICK